MIVRWGVLGCGDIAQRIGIPAIRQAARSELVGIASRDPQRAQTLAREHGVQPYRDFADMLADDQVNAVYIATPPALHCAQTILCAHAGKHVLVEKPMAVTARECAAMIQACANQRVQLMVAYYRRFYPKIQKIKSLLTENVIGKIIFARAQMTMRYNPVDRADERAWRMTPDVGGGGCLIDLGSHRLDLLANFFGAATQVAAFTSRADNDNAVEDAAYLVAEFANGAHALANFNWNTATRTDELEIHGARGIIVATPLDAPTLTIHTSDQVIAYELPRCEITHLPVIENFVRSINGEETLQSSGDDAIRASQMIDAAYQASASGQRVKLC